MNIERRKFVKFAGLTTVGLTTLPLIAKAVGEEGCLNCDSCASMPPFVSPPVNASRWAMIVDLKICREVKNCNEACVKACNKEHNIPNYSDPKDEIKWIWREPFNHAFAESSHENIDEELKHSQVPLLCNHCDNPPCVRVCPTKATWKRKKDGIVMMDWHRCIGCRYCIAACPYGSRSFNYREPKEFFTEQGTKLNPEFPARTRGVVEKCNFCEERLARGQWPACVEACSHKALKFGDLGNPDDPIRKIMEKEFTVRRKPGLGTQPEVYYIL